MGRPCTRCGVKPGHALLRWGAVLEAEGVAGKRHHHTLSHATRAVFRTHTPRGRLAFTLAYLALGGWYHAHIVRSKHNYKRS